MGTLFDIGEGTSGSLAPERFADNHQEDDLQAWVDQCPSIINEGITLLSLGREITTPEGKYIDNLCLDATGAIVLAELKRGRTPRDVSAQLLEYATYARAMKRADLDHYARQRHNVSLEQAFEDVFGTPLPANTPASHRLIILAEDFSGAVIDQCEYLRDHGTDVACIRFRYFDLRSTRLLDTETVSGEIPSQGSPLPSGEEDSDEQQCRWLFDCVTGSLGDLVPELGHKYRLTRGRWSMSLSLLHWPGQHWQRAFCTHKPSSEPAMHVGFWFDRTSFPGLEGLLLEGVRGTALEAHLIFRKTAKTLYVTTSESVLPEIGNQKEADRISRAFRMTVRTLLPLLEKHLEACWQEEQADTLLEEEAKI